MDNLVMNRSCQSYENQQYRHFKSRFFAFFPLQSGCLVNINDINVAEPSHQKLNYFNLQPASAQ